MPTPTRSDAAELFRHDPDSWLDVGEGEAAYRCVGTGPDVVFLHGWPVSGATFRNLVPHLADHVTCHIIDFPSAGDSRFDSTTTLTIAQHIETAKRVVDLLGLESVAVVGHDSGGLIARYALAGDPRLRAMGLINSETPDVGLRFRSFIAARRLPGLGPALGWVAGKRRVRNSKLLFGDAFADRSHLDGEFDEFCFEPLRSSPAHRDAAAKLFRSFDMDDVTNLPEVHRKIDVPVQLVWGDQDPFFPVENARKMVSTFPDARLHVVEGAGLFCHEENPEAVAAALLPVLKGS